MNYLGRGTYGSDVEYEADIFKALSDVTRYRVFKEIRKYGLEGIWVSKIAENLEITPPRVSFSLTRLEYVGAVIPRREGQKVYYRVSREFIDVLGRLLDNY